MCPSGSEPIPGAPHLEREDASASPTRRGWTRLFILLPRPEITILLLGLAWTVGAKMMAAYRHQPPYLVAALGQAVLPDVAFFAALFAGFFGVLHYKPRLIVARCCLAVAAVVLAWAVLNAAWVTATGSQLQPGVLMVLVRDSPALWPVVENHIAARPEYAIPMALTLLVGFVWFVWRVIHPREIAVASRSRLPFAGTAVAVLLVSILLQRMCRPRAEFGFAGEVLGFSSHWHALIATAGHTGSSSNDRSQARRVPRVNERRITPPAMPQEELPNVVLLLLESVPYDSTSLGRVDRNSTPTLVHLASEGTEFVSTRVPVSRTSKAFWAVLTGTTPEIHPDCSEALLVDEAYESLATILRRCGYRSAFFEMSTGTFECAPAVFANTGFDWGWWPENLGDPSARLGLLTGDDFRMIEPAFSWAQEEARPFLLMMITSVAHEPCAVPSWFGRSTGDRLQDYRQAVRFTDAFVGEVCKQLRERGLEDNTVLCVLGDHGESFRPEAKRGRWVPYEEVIRIPWVIRWPGHVDAGGRVEWPCSQMDVTPTILSLIGFGISEAGFDGLDALTPVDPRRRLYFSAWFSQSPVGFVEGNRKVIYWPYRDIAIEYDLQADPRETSYEVCDGAEKEAIVADIRRWEQNSILFFGAKRFRERLLFEHWRTFSSGRTGRAYYVP